MRIVLRCDPELAPYLPRPQAAHAVLPEWLRRMPPDAFSPTHGSAVRTVKKCPPFVDAMTHGFVMTLPCDVRVDDGVFSWDWDVPAPAAWMHPRSPLSFHVPEQVSGSPLFRPDQVVVKFNSFWTIELEAGWSLYATHPANRMDLPFRTLSGLVDADRYHDVGILFPALWVEPGFNGMLKRATPVAQCFPVRREALELSFETLDPQKVEAYDRLGRQLLSQNGVYRKRYRAPRSRGMTEALAQSLEIEPEPPAGG